MTIDEIFKRGIPKYSAIKVIWQHRFNNHGGRIATRIPRSKWWMFSKCEPEDVIKGADGSITVYVNEKAKGVVPWQ